jgi:RNA polymerase sigma-70 factor (ECF subfamily)
VPRKLRQKARQKDRNMNWEAIIPSVAAVNRIPAAETAMDNDQFTAFYQRASRPLWAYLARTSGDPALADDLMQESFIRFLTSSPPQDGEVASRRYLFRIGTNLLRDHWRSSRTVSIDELPPEHSAAPDLCAQSDSRLTLSPALARLRPRDRQLLWLAHAENYSHREIAEITGLATASIRLLLFRARRQMSKLITRGGDV